jgi:hypothetical protein
LRSRVARFRALADLIDRDGAEVIAGERQGSQQAGADAGQNPGANP